MAEEWGPWIEHDGKGCPAHIIGSLVQMECLSKWPVDGVPLDSRTAAKVRIIAAVGYTVMLEGRASDGLCWYSGYFGHIVGDSGVVLVQRYRVRKPRGLTILENLIADLPADPIRETVPREEVPA